MLCWPSGLTKAWSEHGKRNDASRMKMISLPAFDGGTLRNTKPRSSGTTGPPDILMKIRDLIRLLEQDGWYIERTRGSHRQLKHPTKQGLVTIAGKPSNDIATGTLNSILKQAGIKK